MKRIKDTTDKFLSATPQQRKQIKKSVRPNLKRKARPTSQAVLPSQSQKKNIAGKKITSINRRRARSRPQKKFTPSLANKLRIIPLGGCEEVGRNMTIFEYGNDIVILDIGLQFPEENMPGIDYIIPNTSYLKGKEKNIRAVILSHGHLDHIGAAPIILEKLGYPPIIGRPLTLAMTKHRVEDYKKGSAKRLKTINIHKLTNQFQFGPFQIKFFQIEHSIMDAIGVIIQTPVVTVIHPGDWTMEKDNNGKPLIDYTHLARLKRPTVMMLEALGATDVRPSASDQQMKNNLIKLISSSSGRLVIGTFSSQIERVGWIIQTAERLGKKIALDGYSMKMNIEISKELGYIKAKKETFIRVEDIDKYPDNKVVIIATGAQGEGNAVLSRIITGSHRNIKLKKSDTVVLSSSIIPGNENTIQRLKDGLYRQCDNVIHGELMDIHVSGHGNREDITHMIKSVRPDYFIPVYAYHYMLKEAAKLARDTGFKENKIFVPDNGQVMEFDKQGGRLTKQKVPTDYVFVDGLGVGDVSHVVLRDRQMMSEDGMVVVIATTGRKNGKLLSSPDIISRGFIYMKENKKLVEDIRSQVKKIINDYNKTQTSANETFIKDKLRNNLGQFIFQKTKRRPMVLPVIIEV